MEARTPGRKSQRQGVGADLKRANVPRRKAPSCGGSLGGVGSDSWQLTDHQTESEKTKHDTEAPGYRLLSEWLCHL